MTSSKRINLVNLLGHSVASAAGVVLVTVLVLWSTSLRGPTHFTLPGLGGGDFEFMSRDGRLKMGVFLPDEQTPYIWRWRPRHAGMADLILDDNLYFVGDLYGWGFSVPHLLIAAMAAVPILWWILVFRDRQEHLRRLQLGLCMTCGYDVRHASTRCPECGTPCGFTPPSFVLVPATPTV